MRQPAVHLVLIIFLVFHAWQSASTADGNSITAIMTANGAIHMALQSQIKATPFDPLMKWCALVNLVPTGILAGSIIRVWATLRFWPRPTRMLPIVNYAGRQNTNEGALYWFRIEYTDEGTFPSGGDETGLLFSKISPHVELDACADIIHPTTGVKLGFFATSQHGQKGADKLFLNCFKDEFDPPLSALRGDGRADSA